MQGDISSPRTTDDYGYSDSGLEGMIEEKQPLDYLFDTYDATASGISRVAAFLADRPVVAGSVVVGLVGAILGTRLAEYQARRQRMSFYNKAAGTIGSSSAVVADWFSRRPMRTAGEIRKRGMGLIGNHNGKEVTKLVQLPGKAAKPGGDMGKQIGYVIGLIPPILALARNPLVRGMALRMLSRKVTPRGAR
jgi:hypothetical protein